MFPPKRAEDPNEWLSHMCLSVQRAGAMFTGFAHVEQREDHYECTVQLVHPLAPNVKKALETYTRQYARAAGWPLRGVRVLRHAVVFKTSSSSVSRSSKKR